VGKGQYVGGGEIDMLARVGPVLDASGTWAWTFATGMFLDSRRTWLGRLGPAHTEKRGNMWACTGLRQA
jgi:hypothetical protein